MAPAVLLSSSPCISLTPRVAIMDKKTREKVLAYRRLFESVTCCLCQKSGGAMKKNQDDEWVHLMCALWIPELDFTPDKLFVDTSRQKKARLELVWAPF